jgi:hypothetical protein
MENTEIGLPAQSQSLLSRRASFNSRRHETIICAHMCFGAATANPPQPHDAGLLPQGVRRHCCRRRFRPAEGAAAPAFRGCESMDSQLGRMTAYPLAPINLRACAKVGCGPLPAGLIRAARAIVVGAKAAPRPKPVEQPTRFCLSIYRGTAGTLGFAIPPGLLSLGP